MEISNRDRRQAPRGVNKKFMMLAALGGLGFWLANFAISLTPIAAEYRTAVSISYLPMLLEALVGGLVIGLFVSYFLFRFFDRIPTRSPVLKSVLLSVIALVMFTILLEAPAKFLTTMADPMRYFLIGTAFNIVRILTLGVVVGYVYRRWYAVPAPS